MPRDPNNPRWGFQLIPVMDRFMAKVSVEATTGCWLWTGTVTRNGNGYGRFGATHNKSDWAHRESWRLFRGPIPDGKEIDHLCMVRRCVNPAHLEAVTHQVNIWRSFEARLGGFCKSGLHEMTDANRLRDRNGRSVGCRRCKNDYQNRRRWRLESVSLYEGSSPDIDQLTSSGAQE